MHFEQTDGLPSLAQQIGAVVVRERNRLGLTQDELAFTAGVSTRVIHQIENGKETSRFDAIVAALTALGLTLEISPRGNPSEADVE